MRHAKHRHQLGVKTAHRAALMSNLASALIRHGRIKTTLAKAKALRPFIEKAITLAKKADAAETTEQKLHFRRLATARIRDKAAIHYLFNEGVSEFADRNGGYTRIYKLTPRVGDAADMALIELIPASDEGYAKKKKVSKKKKSGSTAAAADEKPEAAAETVTEEAATESAETESEPATEEEAPVAEAVEAEEVETPAEEEEKKD